MTAAATHYDVLVDSDAFIGWLNTQDAHHARATQLFEQAFSQKHQLVTTSFVVSETATVLSARINQVAAIRFLDLVSAYPIIHITEELQQAALALFRKQVTKRTSVVDCSNVVVAQHFGIADILSFDGFYKKLLSQKAS